MARAWFLRKLARGLRLGLGRLRPDASEVSEHGALSDDVAQLQQLPVDPGGTPGRVVSRHLTDEAADLGGRRGTARQRLPSPEEAERTAMPGDHGLWLDQDQAVFPAAPATQDQGPEGPVQRRERQASLSRAFQDEELVPEGQDLSCEGSTRTNAGDHGAEEELDQAEHPEKTPDEGGAGGAGAKRRGSCR